MKASNFSPGDQPNPLDVEQFVIEDAMAGADTDLEVSAFQVDDAGGHVCNQG
jgi:hypothetical protein